MASHTSWEGYLRLNLLSVPVKAYNAAVSQGGKVGFHLIHAKCHNRIRYQKVCPVHGEVPNDEIVSAYQVAKDEYVVVDPDELKKLRPESDKAITIDTFVRPNDIDPIYYGDRSYYLVPDGRVAQKPYIVLQRVMAERQRYAVAKMVLSGREHVVLVRATDDLLVVTLLNFEEQIKKPAEFLGELGDVHIAPKELELAESLVEASTSDEFDFAAYEDEYTARVTKLLEAKAAGKKVVSSHHEEEPVVVNLMDALRQSLARTKKAGSGSPKGKPARKSKSRSNATASAAKHHRPARRKTG